jgi:hypothetical protein
LKLLNFFRQKARLPQPYSSETVAAPRPPPALS